MSGRWSDSIRRAALPSDWPRRRAAVRKRAGERCEATIRGARCPNRGTECDHITPHTQGGTDDLANLQWLCTPCHRRKTGREAAQARETIRRRRFRPSEPHPGLKPT